MYSHWYECVGGAWGMDAQTGSHAYETSEDDTECDDHTRFDHGDAHADTHDCRQQSDE